jgi:hypothetical protein
MGLEAFSEGKLESFVDSGFESRGKGECVCQIYVLAAKVLNGLSGPVCWTLTQYEGPGVARVGCGYWRLLEVSSCFPESFPWYGAGIVDAEKRLVNMRDIFCSEYGYDGYMQIQVGCREGSQIHWPGTCQTLTPLSDFA